MALAARELACHDGHICGETWLRAAMPAGLSGPCPVRAPAPLAPPLPERLRLACFCTPHDSSALLSAIAIGRCGAECMDRQTYRLTPSRRRLQTRTAAADDGAGRAPAGGPGTASGSMEGRSPPGSESPPGPRAPFSLNLRAGRKNPSPDFAIPRSESAWPEAHGPRAAPAGTRRLP